MSVEPVPEAAAPLDDAGHLLQERLGPKVEEVVEQLTALDARVKGFIRANPGACLLGAVAAGYLIGRLASRR